MVRCMFNGGIKGMGKRLTHEEVSNNYRNKEIELLEEFVNNRTKHLLRCKKDGHEWRATYNTFKQRGTGCPECSQKRKKTHEEVEREYLDEQIELQSIYVNTRNKNRLKCLRPGCGYKWEANYNTFQNKGSGCAKCAGNAKKKQEEVVKEYLSKGVINLSIYKNSETKNRLKCMKCKYVWEAKFSNLSLGQGCPACCQKGFSPTKPAYLYVLSLDIPEGNYIKIGICGAERLKSRMREIDRRVKLVSKTYFERGKDAYEEEKRLHEKYADQRVNLSHIVKSGGTEFFKGDVLNVY